MKCPKCDKVLLLVSPMPNYYRYKCACGFDSGWVNLDQLVSFDHLRSENE